MDGMMDEQLILASASPRRHQLLRVLGLSFAVQIAEIDERAYSNETPDALVVRLSETKAATIAARHHGAPSTATKIAVLAADTAVVLDGEVLGKPADEAEASEMLRALRAREHRVFTAISTAYKGRLVTRLCISDVWMRAYGEEEINAYVASGDPLDKAGAYAIQDAGFSPVRRWDGCYTGIMGLPLGLVAELLAEAGIAVAVDVAAVCETISRHCCLRSTPRRC
jgi:septum formation protein